jgi:hypothetical protein
MTADGGEADAAFSVGCRLGTLGDRGAPPQAATITTTGIAESRFISKNHGQGPASRGSTETYSNRSERSARSIGVRLR